MKRMAGRAAALAFVAGLTAAAVIAPDTPVAEPGPAEPLVPPPYTVCPLAEAAQRTTTLSLVGGLGGTAGVAVYASGEIVVDEEVAVDSPAATGIVVNDLTGLARAPVLIRMPDSEATVETSLVGGGLAASACQSSPTGTVILSGGATTEGESLSLLLSNPFAGSATVTVGAASEVGVESEPSLAGIIVPRRSEVIVDLAGLLPSRQSLAVSVTPVAGRVVTSTIHGGAGDIATGSGLEAAADWYLPIPVVEGATASITVATAGTAEVPFQLDTYDQDGLFEAAYEDTVPARGQVTIQVADLFEGPGAVRVVAAAPVVATLRYAGEGIRASLPGVPTLAPNWVLPGAGELGDTSVTLFNPGEVDVVAEILAGDLSAPLESVTVPGASMVSVPVTPGHGAHVQADGDLAANWLTVTENGVAGDGGRPAGQ